MLKLSVIIPVYQVEKYIHPCLESVFKQGLSDEDFEVIIVNDGTKDKSMEVIADIISQHANITIINQENQGLSVARNNGIAQAKGEYILMPDSDDLLIEDSVKPLLEIAIENHVDMLIADFLQMGDREIEEFLEKGLPPKKDISHKVASGIDLLEEAMLPYYWRSIYRREFLITNSISFIPDITSQDVAFTNECLLKAKRCIRLNIPMNIYRWGHPSTSFTPYNIQKAKDFCVSIARIWELSQMKGLAPDTRERQKDIVFRYFRSFTFKITYGHIKDKSQIIEAIDYMRKLSQDMNFKNGFKQRLYTFMYHHTPHTFIILRYYYQEYRRRWFLP